MTFWQSKTSFYVSFFCYYLIIGTADSSDYVSTGVLLVTIPIGSTNGSMQCLNISIINDDEIEGNETFMVEIRILQFSSVRIVARNRFTEITIIDDEG